MRIPVSPRLHSLVLLPGNDPDFPPYQDGVMPLYYKSLAGVLGLEPRSAGSKPGVLPIRLYPNCLVGLEGNAPSFAD